MERPCPSNLPAHLKALGEKKITSKVVDSKKIIKLRPQINKITIATTIQRINETMS